MKTIFIKYITLFIMLFVLTCGFTVLSHDFTVFGQETSEYRLPVFETSDIHGYIANTTGEEVEYFLAFIADKVEDARRAASDQTGDPEAPVSDAANDQTPRTDVTILLDGGDIYQGNSLSNLLYGKPLTAAFAQMEYDAVALGNHEFDWGIEEVIDSDGTMMDCEYEDRFIENPVPVIVSNLYRDGEKPEWVRDYVILQKTARNEQGNELPVSVAVIGYAEDYSSSVELAKFAELGYSIQEDPAALENLAHELKADKRCDAVIVLAHYEAAALAQQLKADTDIDLVLGGHTHENERGTNEHGLSYIQPAGDGLAYAYAELVFDMDEDGNPVFQKVDASKAVNIAEDPALLYQNDANTEELDARVLAITDAAFGQVEDVLEEKIGYITQSIVRYEYFPESNGRASSGGNWYCSLMARAVNADVGFFNLYGMRDDLLIPEGKETRDITLGDLYTLFPFSNIIYRFDLTYPEFLRLLEYSLTEPGSDIYSMMTGVECYYTEQTVNAIVHDGELIYANGEWYDGHENDHISVAATDYLVTSDKDENDENGMSNPLCEWKDTDRVTENNIVDVDGAIAVLTAEAAEHDGLLSVDMTSYYIYGDRK